MAHTGFDGNLFTLQQPGKVFQHPGKFIGLDQVRDGHAQQLLARIAQHVDRRLVDILVGAALIGDKQGIDRMLQHRVQPALTLLNSSQQLLSLGDIAADGKVQRSTLLDEATHGHLGVNQGTVQAAVDPVERDRLTRMHAPQHICHVVGAGAPIGLKRRCPVKRCGAQKLLAGTCQQRAGGRVAIDRPPCLVADHHGIASRRKQRVVIRRGGHAEG